MAPKHPPPPLVSLLPPPLLVSLLSTPPPPPLVSSRYNISFRYHADSFPAYPPPPLPLVSSRYSISFRYHADSLVAPDSLLWELIAVNDGSFSRNKCPFYGERTRWGRSPESFQRCDCTEPSSWC
jgi:hypothetical protein